jgi:hypothetical protein
MYLLVSGDVLICDGGKTYVDVERHVADIEPLQIPIRSGRGERYAIIQTLELEIGLHVLKKEDVWF